MASAREMRLRIQSVKNIAQVTRALEAVSASKVRKAVEQVENTRPYANKAWQVLRHVAGQPGRSTLHPLLTERTEVKNTLVLLISSDRGLAGAYNTNIIRFNMQNFKTTIPPPNTSPLGAKVVIYSCAVVEMWWQSLVICLRLHPLWMYPLSGILL